jgi:hypothetical protein
MKHTKGKWIALKNHQYCEHGLVENYYEPDDDEINYPYVKIVSEHGQTIVTNHDLFTFRNDDDARLIALAPEMHSCLNEIEKILLERRLDDALIKVKEVLSKVK